eukprot:maker-scaffold_49-snap-gene-0.4-mRNA-1 protein AED:0.23 eAED:0.23 QI:362/1/1/1/1/1/4/92/168
MGELGSQLLRKEFKALSKSPPLHISVGLHDDNLNCWEVLITGPTGSLLEGGFFKALLTFPETYPMQPPEMVFQTEMFHPNIYPDGKVCISILHAPGEDAMNQQEKSEERWRPILGAESILVSVLSMLTDPQPNLESPANVDASTMFMNNYKQYKRKVRKLAQKSADYL